MREFFEREFDKILLLVVLFLVCGLWLRRPDQFAESLVNMVLGALVMALTGGARAIAQAINGGPKIPPAK